MEFWKNRASLIILCQLFVPHLLSVGQDADEQQRLRELYLKSRQPIQVVPSPTPTAKTTPVPATPASSRPKRPRPELASPAPSRPRARITPEESNNDAAADEAPAGTPTPAPSASAMTTVTPSPTPVPTPSPTPKKKRGWFFFGRAADESDNTIVIQKSGENQGEAVQPGHYNGQWHYLSPALRKAIDDARVARNRWKYVIVHNSGTRQGSARIFDFYHRRVRRMVNGLAYHFVIGNGTTTGDGQIEIGNRWTVQLPGGHVHSDYLNNIGLGICLVGDFNRDLPTRSQYEALDELIRYLRQRVGKTDGHYSIVLGHREINPRPTDCPGNQFPLNWLHRSFPNQ